ncbi:hypothetical protein EJ08DRAFT_592268 [Tothia fuscella]|uniref:Ribonuclease P/MRP protein subunit POP5 n=1 Tax=Tothia fuscella TaxID=1048955 RepID=A0A9P4NN44_9PEZI|nr:hypothetical protein EJ08DRAFT_592268 [Tothia fuscella]
MVRIKHRYLLINILYPSKAPNFSTKDDIPDVIQFRAPTPDNFETGVLLRMIKEGVNELYGDYGLGMIAGSLKIIYLSAPTSTAIIRVSRDHYRLVWTALTMATRLPKPVDLPCVIQVVRTSGTIRKAEEEAIRRAKASIVRSKQSAQTNGSVGIDILRDFNLVGRYHQPSPAPNIRDGPTNHDSSESEVQID